MNNYQPKNAGFVDKYLIYPIANIFSHPLHKLGITPNQITIFTFLIRSIGVYYMFLKQKPNLVFSLFFISWFTDALDGIIARKYNMKSELGAYLDVWVDTLTMTSAYIVLLLKYYNKNLPEFATLLGSVGVSYFLMSVKLRGDKKNKKNNKPWERLLSCIPVDIETNIAINSIDPGFIYMVTLIGLFYGLFKLR